MVPVMPIISAITGSTKLISLFMSCIDLLYFCDLFIINITIFILFYYLAPVIERCVTVECERQWSGAECAVCAKRGSGGA